MSAQTPAGAIIPVSRTVRRNIEVAVVRATFGNCTLGCMTCANSCRSFYPVQYRPETSWTLGVSVKLLSDPNGPRLPQLLNGQQDGVSFLVIAGQKELAVEISPL